MIPIVTPEEMAAIDAAAPEPVEVLVDRAGAAVARRRAGDARRRRTAASSTCIAGKGNNGADGRVAAERLRARGVAGARVRRPFLPAGAAAERPRDRRRLRHRLPRWRR